VLERAVELGRANLAEDDPDVLLTAYQLGSTLQRADDPMAARRVLEEAYAAGQFRLGDADPLIVQISHDLGVVAEELGNRHEARKAFGRVAEFGPGALGGDHWAVARARAYLGQDQNVRPEVLEPSTSRVFGPPPAPTSRPASGPPTTPPAQAPPPTVRPVPEQRTSPADGQPTPAHNIPGQPTPATYGQPTPAVYGRPTPPDPNEDRPAGGHRPTPPGQGDDQPAAGHRPTPPAPNEDRPAGGHPQAQPFSGPGIDPTAANDDRTGTGAGAGAGAIDEPTSVFHIVPPSSPSHPAWSTSDIPNEPGTPAAQPRPPWQQQEQDQPPWQQHQQDRPPLPAQSPPGQQPWPVQEQPPWPTEAQPPWPAQDQQPWPSQDQPSAAPPSQPAWNTPADELYRVEQPFLIPATPPAYPSQPAPPHDHRKGLGLFAAIAAVLAAVIAVAALVFVLANRSGDNGNDSDVPTLGGGPTPTDVRLQDEGARIKVTWTDPTAGTVSFLVAMAHPGEQLNPVATLGPGTTSYEMSALNPALDYCFVVVAVYRDDQYATSAQACTAREPVAPASTTPK
jgi:tetratricopeptide repeat protein